VAYSRVSALSTKRICLGKLRCGEADEDPGLTSSTDHFRALLRLVRYLYLFITNEPPAWTELARF
jgi:hypothetical protein